MDGLKNIGSTPVKRLGLSRKRRISCLNNVNAPFCSPKNAESPSEIDIKKQNIVSIETCSESLKVEEISQNNFENKSKLELSMLDAQAKYVKRIEELENLYSIWANGFKNAFSHLIKLLEERPGEPVNVKQLLMQLRIWEIVSDHFKNDSELCCYLSDSEDND